MGVDVVSLANNHVFDYGSQAFLDTLDTLTAAGIPCAGAGRNLNDAMRARYFLAGGMKLAYIAAAHTESYMYSFPATAEKPGLLPCYEGDALLRAVKDARKRADFVIVYLHWGIEYEPMPEKRQVELAHSLIDSGADAVLGTHPHVLQGLEFYKDKPIAYSLGNFWFNVGWVDSALLEIELTAPGDCILRVLPCATEGGTARLMSEQERARIFRHLESISSNIRITEGGVVEGPAK
jgi:poly-gamma-glutamate synthesis protein (capsule biosynthesis protein)